MRPLEIMGLQEVAEATGVKRGTIRAWDTRGHLPPADARLGSGPVWRTSTIKAWIAGAGRERIARAREEGA